MEPKKKRSSELTDIEHKVDKDNKDIIFILYDEEIDFILEIVKDIKNEDIQEIVNNIIFSRDSDANILFNIKEYLMLYQLINENDDISNEKKIQCKKNLKNKKYLIDTLEAL